MVVQYHEPGVGAELFAAQLGHGGQSEQGEEEREGAHGRGMPNIGPRLSILSEVALHLYEINEP
jgi:hypothetical protein